jgi:hypothetical protein
MPSARDLRHRVSFQRRAANDDGQRLGAFAEEFSRLADISYIGLKTGGETTLQGRLQGTAPVSIFIRDDSQTRAIDSAWRGVVSQGPMAGTYNIRSKAPTHRVGWIGLTCDVGDDD